MKPLSVVIITYNEEANIGRCLDSVQDIADDIVVVDSYSTDATVRIALGKCARVVQHPFQGHIEQKNYAITQAKYQHVLSLDADECIDESLEAEIKTIKQNWSFDGYSINRLNNYCGAWIKHGAWYPDIKIRLWDSSRGKWKGINPHDKFVMNDDAKTGHLKGRILHYSYRTVEEHRNKIHYFSEIAAKAYAQQGKRSSAIKTFLHPVFRFIRDYFLKLGFLDGRAGLIIAILTAREVRLKYQKLLRLQQKL